MKDKQFKLRDGDIESSKIDRRSFLAKVGVAATGAVVMTGAAGCFTTDVCDTDTGDPSGAASDSDPSDPVRSDTDVANTCDTD